MSSMWFKKYVPKEFINKLFKEYLDDYEYICGNILFPENDMRIVEL